MKKLKLIRIDETPNRVFGQNPGELMPGAQIFTISGIAWDEIKKIDSFLGGNFPKKNNFSLPHEKEEDPGYPSFANPIYPNTSSQPPGTEISSFLLGEVIKANKIILDFNNELSQRGVEKEKIVEFQHDAFKIGLKVAEGILLQVINPWLASRQFELACIHIENTIINLENLAEERIANFQRIVLLKQICQELCTDIKEFKKHFGLDRL